MLANVNKVGWIVLFYLVCSGVHSHAATSPSATRAFLYQQETRSVLVARGWRISRDQTGKLVASHRLAVLGASSSGKLELAPNSAPENPVMHALALLTLTFQPESVSRTKCGANILAYTVWAGSNPNKLPKPLPFNNPDTTKEIEDIMAKAEGSLIAKHPEYSAK